MKELPKGIRVKSGYLYINFRHNGQRHFRSTGLKAVAANVAEAVKIRKGAIEALKYGVEDEPEQEFKAGTFAAVAQIYLDELETKPSTRASYKQLLQTYWMPFLQHRQIAAIEQPLMRRLVRETEWSSRKVQKNAISVLRQVFAFAAEDGYRQDNPAAKLIVKRSKSEKRDPDPYTIQERDVLLKWLEQNTSAETHAYFLTAFLTGMRTGELLALTWEDYDGRSLRVSKARVRGEITSTKTGETRTVLLPERLTKVLNALPSRFRKDIIFSNQYGRHYQAGYHLNRKFREAHHMTLTRHRSGPYPWRHTYASIGLTSGAEPAWLAKQLGHSLQMFYNVYSTWMESADRDQQQLAKLR